MPDRGSGGWFVKFFVSCGNPTCSDVSCGSHAISCLLFPPEAVIQRPVNRLTSTLARYSRRALVIAAFAGAVEVAEAASRWATLEAIHKLENPRNLTRPGRHGELGAYQFKASTWRMHTNIPFSRAIERPVSDLVAVKHYEWLRRGLEAGGVEATPYNIALAWNCGLSAVLSGRAPRVSHDYAQRAVNLAATLPRANAIADAR